MTKNELLQRIRDLRIPEKTREVLRRMCVKLRAWVEKIVLFIRRHRGFCEAMIIGAIAAYLLIHVPLIGAALAQTAIITAAAVGLMKELSSAMKEAFGLE